MLLPSVLAVSHANLTAGTIALVGAGAAVVYVLVAVALPTRRCGRCHGDRVQFTRHWLTGRARTRPCRRCSGTGRVPRLGGRTIHRLIWSVRGERDRSR
jgi:hypothetical protein